MVYLKKTLKEFDASEYGGAPMLGLKGLVVKAHGSSNSKEVKNSIIQCSLFKEQKINEKIKDLDEFYTNISEFYDKIKHRVHSVFMEDFLYG